ncbi:extracellular solute-binding protein [Humibacter albus]|jgi:multiple sugar transport system substrate-binding protein|uniref:extracellular solute-binding protein n=1 Tax=Humibacter albus TaxID=427754 RepID=UPI0003B42FD2|nr:extracellular solute-binding protein [Humibacter albus]
MKRILSALAIGAVAAAALSGCSAGSGSDKVIKVAYQKFGNFTQMDTQMKSVAKQFEAQNKGYTVKLVPIQASENDYYTKLSLMNKAASTAPDVLYEDTFLIKSDADAGYLAPLDSYVKDWSDWSKFPDNAKQAGEGENGKLYGISMGTDTRALWYNKDLLKKAGVEVPWQPKSWQDVLDAAKKVKAAEPGVTPINIYSGKGGGEQSTMQGFEMLLYGTHDTLYDSSSKKWIAGSKGFVDSLDVIKEIYQGGLGPSVQNALDPNFGNTVSGQLLPQGKLAIDLDGSWLPQNWIKSGAAPWSDWNKVMGEVAMPTQDGASPGTTSMSGGWTLALGSKSKNKDAAWDFIKLALNKKNSLKYDVSATQIAVRTDVASDPTYTDANPTNKFFSDLVKVTHFRPATSVYPKVSNNIQVAMESVMTGQATPKQAAKTYDDALPDAVGGAKHVTTK